MNLKENKGNYLPYQTSIEHWIIFLFFFAITQYYIGEPYIELRKHSAKKSSKIPMIFKENKGKHLPYYTSVEHRRFFSIFLTLTQLYIG